MYVFVFISGESFKIERVNIFDLLEMIFFLIYDLRRIYLIQEPVDIHSIRLFAYKVDQGKNLKHCTFFFYHLILPMKLKSYSKVIGSFVFSSKLK